MAELSYKQKLTKVKYWLTAAEYCQRKIDAYINETQELRSLAEKCTASYSHAHVSGGPYDRMGSAAIRMVEYEQKIQKEIKELLDRKERIQAVITNCLDDYNQRIVMEYRYVHLYKWEEVAEKTHYSWAGVFKVHDKALKRLAEQYPFEPEQKREENQDAGIQTL